MSIFSAAVTALSGSPSKTAASAWSFAKGEFVSFTDIGAMLRLYRDKPLTHKSIDELLPELAKAVAAIKDSPKAKRFRQIVAELSQVSRTLADNRQGEEELTEATVAAAISGPEAMAEALAMGKDASAGLENLLEKRYVLRLAAERLWTMLEDDHAKIEADLRRTLQAAAVQKYDAAVAAICAAVSPVLDKLSEADDLLKVSGTAALPRLDSLVGLLPPKTRLLAEEPVPSAPTEQLLVIHRQPTPPAKPVEMRSVFSPAMGSQTP